MDDGVSGSSVNAGELGGTELDRAALEAVPAEGEDAESPGGGAHGVVVGEQGGGDGAGELVAPGPQALGLLVDPRELGIALGGQLPARGSDGLLLGGEPVGFGLGRLQGLHGGDLGVLEDGLAPSELVDLPLDGGEVPGGVAPGGQALAQGGGSADDLPDLVLGVGGALLGLGQGGGGEQGGALVVLEAGDSRLDAGQNGQGAALVREPGECGVDVLQVDEESLLGDGGAGHGRSFRSSRVGMGGWALLLRWRGRCAQAQGPGVGADRGDVRGESTSAALGGGGQPLGERGKAYPLCGPVGSADEVGAPGLQVLAGRVVAQVRGEEDVRAGLAGAGQQGVSRPSRDGDGLDGGVQVPSHEDAWGRVGQGGGDGVGEVAQAGGRRQGADAPDALGGVGGAGLQGHGAEQPDGGGQGGGHSPMGGVEAGVGVEQGDAGADEAVDDAALGIGGGHVVGSAQVEGVVGDDHVGAALDGLIDDGHDGIDGQQDRCHGCLGVPTDEPVGVPGLGEPGRCGGLDEGDDVGDGQRLGGRGPFLGGGWLAERGVDHAARLTAPHRPPGPTGPSARSVLACGRAWGGGAAPSYAGAP